MRKAILMSLFACSVALSTPSTVLANTTVWTAPNANSGYYDVPLDRSVQDYIAEECMIHGIDIPIVMAVIEHESAGTFDPTIVSKTNDVGLMQINKSNKKYFEGLLGAPIDLTNPYTNIWCGVNFLSEYYHKYGDWHKALMAYNMGEATAKKHWKNGTTSSKYSRAVMELVPKYER